MNEFVNERWMAIPDFEPFEVSDYGRVRNAKTGRFRKIQTTRLGYKHFVVKARGEYHSLMIHRIVAAAFVGKPTDQRKEVNHIDGVKSNNHFENLEWVSHSENMKHAWVNELMHYVPRKPNREADSPNKNNKSGFKGVAPSLSRWRAVISHNRKVIYIGTFDTPEEAHQAYLNFKKGLEG